MDREFEYQHRQEIERVAFRIYQDRMRLCQEDNPDENWKRACSIVRSIHSSGGTNAQVLANYFADRSTDGK